MSDINGIQLRVEAIDTEGDTSTIEVVLAIHTGGIHDEEVLEVKAPDDIIYSVDLASFQRALNYAAAERAVEASRVL